MSSILLRIITQRDRYLEMPTRFLSSLGITPTILNIVGLMFGVLTSVAIAKGQNRAALKLVLVSTFADVLDGPVARNTKVASPLGNVLDASCDRAVDIAIYSGFLVRATKDESPLRMWLAWINLVADTTRSYIRARAESIFPENSAGLNVGIMSRPRKLVLLLMALIWPDLSIVSLALSAFLSVVSIYQRVKAVYSKKLII
jgi:CDP-diacylglycerol---glycerol-3-phosphate 3-phosphatidyltransferase